MEDEVPLVRPLVAEGALKHVEAAIRSESLAGNGTFGRRCAELLEGRFSGSRVLVVPSCTAALELSALLTQAGPGDEVIMPSFAFPTLASAFVLRGAKPVFVDVLEETLCLNPDAAASATNERTVAVCALNYAGIGGDLPALRALATDSGTRLIEDNAHGLLAEQDGQPLGSFGDLSALSFHATKNVPAGEAGALVINDDALTRDAEILQEKGTNRASFLRGEVARYEWIETGTSALLGEATAALLLGQLEAAEDWTKSRRASWACYHEALAPLEESGLLRRPSIPPGASHDAHIYWVITPSQPARDQLIKDLRGVGIGAAFHYVPLHDSPAGSRSGEVAGTMEVTEEAGACLVRLPLWPGLPGDVPERVAQVANLSLRRAAYSR